ncbi:MAG: flagellar biosynthetic protein FliO [Oscillibacter sp.]|jgi:flagellar protein FliO/FliZ|nr:flagellar biosynthetic protein FliO [Oscillibacter sp.]MCI9482594.1 flagellar biosynthetic protein FliO [Oscillibacter sp.]
MHSSAFSLLWLTGILLLILALAYVSTRFLATRSGIAQPGKHIQILEQQMLGRDQKLALARVGERWFLLGIAPSGVSLVAEFTAEEAASWQAEAQEGRPSFWEAVVKVMDQKGRR